ncbi:hypothetical protein IV203_033859 [Nitzschia inconspicua]|uniref:Uncharacterized protein n=1 Tax=Nitzschia inconspicua TaxID=303405 RepID=A0A9K3Q7D0_9STRA|nr:hypothetical protein IV203_033859 [Nitzschia inconspicua]
MRAARETAALKCTVPLPESLEECQAEYKQLRKRHPKNRSSSSVISEIRARSTVTSSTGGRRKSRCYSPKELPPPVRRARIPPSGTYLQAPQDPFGHDDHLRIALAWTQRLSGTSYSILEKPDDPLPHLETVFFPFVRAHLRATHSTFELQEKYCTPRQRVNDTHIMDIVLSGHIFTPAQIRQINDCRLYLQVHTIANLGTAGGTHMDRAFIHGETTVTSSTSAELEIIQHRPKSAHPWNQWKRACTLCRLQTPQAHQRSSPHQGTQDTHNAEDSNAEAAFVDIDWQCHERSGNTFKDGPHMFLVEFLYGWLPLGKLVSRYNPVKFPIVCPSCDEPNEDFKHFLTCPNPERRKWHAALKTSLRHRCDPQSTRADGPPTPQPDYDRVGQLTPRPVVQALDHPPVAIPTTESHWDLYDLKPKCSLQSQRRFYYPTVEDHFRRDTDASSLENWLETYEAMIMQSVRDCRTNSDRRLRQIDEVFHFVRTAPPRNPTPTMASATTYYANTDNSSHQHILPPQRITSPISTLETTTTTARTSNLHIKQPDNTTMNFSSSLRRFCYHYCIPGVISPFGARLNSRGSSSSSNFCHQDHTKFKVTEGLRLQTLRSPQIKIQHVASNYYSHLWLQHWKTAS